MTRSVLTRLRPRRPPRWLLAGILWGLAPFLAYPAERAEPKEAPRPEAIRTDGVPPVPLELLDGLRRYQEIRPSTFIDWAPGGGLLVSKRLTKVHQLYHVGEPLGCAKALLGKR